jgi:hypothetical protein
MGRKPKHLLPQMRVHKGSGHARVRINGTEHWLGQFGSPEALTAYDRLIADLPPLNVATFRERISGGVNQGRARDATRKEVHCGADHWEAPRG